MPRTPTKKRPSVRSKTNDFNKSSSSDYYMKMCFSQEFSDITIKIHNETIYAHKIVLAKNEVFRAMLMSNLSEATDNVLKIIDCDVNIFKTFLKCLYTDNLEIDDVEETVNLLALADKYLYSKLKSACERKLFKDLNVENSINTLAIATKYRCDDLKNKASLFIANKFELVVKTPEFQTMISNNENILLIMNSLHAQPQNAYELQPAVEELETVQEEVCISRRKSTITGRVTRSRVRPSRIDPEISGRRTLEQ